jgi:hypothetical protein
LSKTNNKSIRSGYIRSSTQTTHAIRKKKRIIATDSYKIMALDPSFAVQAFTLIASICAAESIDKALSTCGRIDGDSKTVVYYSCGVRSTFAAMFAFATSYGMYTIYQRYGQTPVTPRKNDTEA